VVLGSVFFQHAAKADLKIETPHPVEPAIALKFLTYMTGRFNIFIDPFVAAEP